nr:plant cysteine oxidase 2-like isoform X2 [Ipomoea batatas]
MNPGRGQEISEASKKKKKKPKMRSKKRKNSFRRETVQKLFETCKQVFADAKAGDVLPPADIQRLKSILDDLKPEDVNLQANMKIFETSETQGQHPPIAYIHIYESHKFSIGIFCLPPSGVIPLHNHPGMTVFSKLLFGSMQAKSYDWVERVATCNKDNGKNLQQGLFPQLARVHVEKELTAPCEASVLFPAAGGNLHCFKAITACAILDVLGPPYSESEGRRCTYYQDFPFPRFSDSVELEADEDVKSYVWLEEREKPEEFVVYGAHYTGPTIVGIRD